MRNLVRAGYGDYEAAARADIMNGFMFLLLQDTVEDRVDAWLNTPIGKR